MYVGIDLGTTNSLISVFQNGNANIIPNSLGDLLTPSVVGVDDDGYVIVGQAASERLALYPEKTVSMFKRHMGTEKKIELGSHSFRPEELSALLLKQLKEDGEVYLRTVITDAVISVPAYFNDSQRKATKVAAEIAGINVISLINEPTAAALAYGIRDKSAETKFIVVDLGGGTFDVSILEMFEGVMEVRACAGDNYLGGDNFTQLLIDFFVEKCGEVNKFTYSDLSTTDKAKLYKSAELVKKQLSHVDIGEMSFYWEDELCKCSVSRDELLNCCESLLERIKQLIKQAIREAEIHVNEIDQVFLVGGATRMQMMRSLISKLFGKLPMVHLDPDQVVAMGASIQAALRADDKALKEIVVTDVCPYTLGTSVVEFHERNQNYQLAYLPIIERNSIIPISQTQILQTVKDNQSVLEVKVYQGEFFEVEQNILLGTVKIDVPRKPVGEVKVQLRYSYDINGLLEVEVISLLDNVTKTIVIEHNSGVLSPDEVEASLKKLSQLKVHPRKSAKNLLLISRMENLYQKSLGEQRQHIASMIIEFKSVLETGNNNQISRAYKYISGLVNNVEQDLAS